jgi:hypothetical protein
MEDNKNKMGRKQFILRLSLWVIVAAIVPVCFLFFKYGFVSHGEARLTGWGVFAIIVTGLILIGMVREVLKGLPYGSMMRQCITGVLKLIPLFCVIMLLDAVKNSVQQLEEFLIVLLICEAVAVPINPIPRWAAENSIDMQKKAVSEIARNAIDYFFVKKDAK